MECAIVDRLLVYLTAAAADIDAIVAPAAADAAAECSVSAATMLNRNFAFLYISLQE